MLPAGTVTFLFTDIEDSTPLWEREPEKMAGALQIHNATLRQAIERNGGVVFKTVGDAFQAAFTTAPQALRAAIEGQRLLQSATWNELGPLQVRMGLHTGEAIPMGEDYDTTHTLNRVARVMSAGYGGQVLLSQETADLVQRELPEGVSLKDLGEHELKGMALPEHLFQLLATGLREDFPQLATQSRSQHNLPRQLTRFIGRRKETAEVKALLEDASLVTLTGSGGVGKTRLSIQVAEEMLESFPQGIWYVELAPISDPVLVARTVARELGLFEEPNRSIEDTLTLLLRSRKTLIVLDNCEHLIDACVQLVNLLLHACPKLKILISSREALGVEGEVVYRVPSLPIPDIRQAGSLDAIREAEAVKLFVERGRSVLPSFQLTPQNAPNVVQICQRLDGIPLAIELAAARLNMLSTEQLAARLDKAFRLLTGGSRSALPRQQTLRAAIDWSYQLLSQQERCLLLRLAVFSGGCLLEAAEAVCSGDGLEKDDILDLLSNLVNKSVVLVEFMQGQERRYRLLETVRQYAREKLYDSGESEKLRDRHLEYFLHFAEQAELQLYSQGRPEWNRRLNAELDNLRAAIEWSYTGKEEPEPGLRIAVAISRRFMQPAGLFQEAERWIETGLEGQAISPLPDIVIVRAENVLAWVVSARLNMAESRELIEDSVRRGRLLGSSAYAELSWALWSLASAIVDLSPDDFPKALELASESVETVRRLPPTPSNLWYLAFALERRALLQMDQPGMEASCERDAQESYHMFVRAGDRWSAGTLWFLGGIALNRGEISRARELFEEALSLFQEVDDKNGIVIAYGFLSMFFDRMADYQQASAHLKRYIQDCYSMAMFNFVLIGLEALVLYLIHSASSQDHQEAIQTLEQAAIVSGAVEASGGQDYHWNFISQEHFKTLLSRLTQARYDASLAQGRGMDMDEAVKYAVGILDKLISSSRA